MKDLRYKGSFLAKGGHTIRVELWQETDTPYTMPRRLVFPAADPLTIEWEVSQRETAVERSHATLRVVSLGDRDFLDLYSGKPGMVRMDVYTDGSLYWSGTLDPEQYSEPYEQLRDYEVELTFGDLGILSRKKYTDYGVRSLRQIVETCRHASECNLGATNWQKVSVERAAADRVPLEDLPDAIGVSSENWVDSDGESQDLLTVLEAVLQPLGLKIRQRAGLLWVYDLDYLIAEHGPFGRVYWTGTEQTLSADRVYNKGTIKWQTYVRGDNLLETEPWGEERPPVDMTNLWSHTAREYEDAEYWSVALDSSDRLSLAGCTLWCKPSGRNIETESPAKIMYVVAQQSGSDTQGVAVRWPSVTTRSNGGEASHYLVQSHGCGASLHDGASGTLLRTSPIRLQGGTGNVFLNLKVPLLMTLRVNPFEDAEEFEGNVENRDNHWKHYAQVLYMPIRLHWVGDDGSEKWWHNYTSATLRGSKLAVFNTLGEWMPSESTSWLNYYNEGCYTESDPGTALNGGWATNKSTFFTGVNRISKGLFKTDGQILPYPGDGGIDIEIAAGGWCVRPKDSEPTLGSGETYTKCRQIFDLGDYGAKWILLGCPELTVIPSHLYEDSLDASDVEYSLDFFDGAEEELSLQTMCGTKRGGVPMSRGAYLHTDTGMQVDLMARNGQDSDGQEDSPEMLTLASLRAGYGQRRTVLSGEARLDTGDIRAWREDNQGEHLFWIAGETQNIIEWTSEITILEIL